jgi:hypothetical protein
MKLSEQCCSLDQAKRLKELGVIGDRGTNLFFWIHLRKTKYRVEWTGIADHGMMESVTDLVDYWPAFTVAELGVMLPSGYDTMKITVQGEEYGWRGYDISDQQCPPIEEEFYPTEAQARASMLIHLLENNLITPSEVNNRLNQ